MSFLSKDVGIDLGTANTLVYMKGKGIIMREPSVVAVDTKTDEVRCVGGEAKAVIGRTPGSIVAVRPLKDGVIADFDITANMLENFLKKACGNSMFSRPRVVICIPSGVTEVERRAVREDTLKAGARQVSVIEGEADGAEAAPAKKDGSDKATAPTDEAPATTEAPPATTENTPAATEVPPATTEKPAANIEEPPATAEAPIRPASENFDPGDAFPPSSTATEEAPHSGIYINPHTFTQPASEETAPTNSEDTTPTVTSEPTSPRKSTPGFRLVMQIACFVFAAGACVDILLLAMLRKNVRVCSSP